MASYVTVGASDAKYLIEAAVTEDGVAVDDGYELVIRLIGVRPLATDPDWQQPDDLGDGSSGIFVGTNYPGKTFPLGSTCQVWRHLVSDPEDTIRPLDNLAYFG